MNCVIFKLKFKVLLNPWKIIFYCCIVDWIELDSNDASIFGLSIVRDFVRLDWYFWKNGLFVFIAGLRYIQNIGATIIILKTQVMILEPKWANLVEIVRFTKSNCPKSKLLCHFEFIVFYNTNFCCLKIINIL